MLARSMHHCAFLIITFLTYTLCIRNGDAVFDAKRNSDSNNYTPEARQSAFHQSSDFDTSGFIPSTGGGGGVFRFPDKHQANANNPNEQPSSQAYTNPYPNNHPANTNQGANPHNLAFNTGERPPGANNHNHYPYQQHPNAIASFANRESPAWPNANALQHQHQLPARQDYKNPNYPPQGYQQRPTYAQAYDNYLFNRQPNYNRRPTPPPQQPPVTDLSYGPYHEGHLTRPYQHDLPSTTGLQAGTYPPQYANQFGNSILPFGIGGGSGGGGGSGAGGGILGTGANPLSGLLNSFGGGAFAAGNPLSMQIIRGLENIARNDDLQCVPKVLCQMLGSPARRAQLPAFITSPMVTSFVSSLPSSSPALIYGRAALLGLSGGEYKCARTYPRCPQSEDDILYYLNNHRGGFFKFFSEPEPILDAENLHSSSSSTSSSGQQQSQPSLFNFLTGLGSTSSNQGNLNSLMSDAVTNGIGSLFGNIISGFVGGQAATRRQDDDIDNVEEENSDLIESNSTATEPEGRILNNKSNILAYVEPLRNPISFPPPADTGNDNYEVQQFDTEFRFPSTSHRDANDAGGEDDGYRRGKRVNFIDSDAGGSPHRTKMIFPDRTGTGNLRFDNDEYFRVGKIINRPDYESFPPSHPTTTRRPPSDYRRETHRPVSSYSGGGLNRYASSSYNRGSKDDSEGNVYVTNGQGITEYYINAQGRKVYL